MSVPGRSSLIPQLRDWLGCRVSLDGLGALTAGALALAVYVATAAPTVTWRNGGADSGDLVSAAYTLGIPHPPGYPLYTIIVAAVVRLPWGEPAHLAGLFSALAAAAAIALITRTVRGWIKVGNGEDNIAHLVAPGAALTLAFAPAFWSQATIAEVYALEVLIVAALFAVLLWESRYRLALVGLLFGLGLAHHLTIILSAPGVLFYLADKPRTRRQIAWAVVLLVAPLLLYLYLPLRASADPPINWGDPRSPEGLGWMVTASAYRAYLFNLPTADVFRRAATTARFLFQQFTFLGVALGLYGIYRMLASPERSIRRLFWALAPAFVLICAYAILYASRDSSVYLLTAFMVFTLWIAYGLGGLARRLSPPGMRAALMAVLILLPLYNLLFHFQPMDVSRDRTAFDYAKNAFQAVPLDAIIVADGDEHLFALWYYRHVIAGDSSRVDVVSAELLQFDWYYGEMRRAMPALAAEPPARRGEPLYRARLDEIIARGREAGRAVYATAASDWLAEYVFTPQGVLLWIQERNR